MNAVPGSVNRASEFRPDDDHYNTPREASWPFVRAAAIPGKVWECACGEGALAAVLTENGHDVVATTLRDRGYGKAGVNFLETRELLAPAIVTNPPFSLLDEFIEHAHVLGVEYLAMFARTKFVEGADRYARIHSRNPFSIQYQFIERIKFFAGDTPKEDQPGWNTEAFAWFVWVKNWSREPIVRWLHRNDGLQRDLFEQKREKL